MSLYDKFNERKNNGKLNNTEQNILSNNDNDNDFYFKYDDSYDEKHKIMGKSINRVFSDNKIIEKTKFDDNINNKNILKHSDYFSKNTNKSEDIEKPAFLRIL